MKKYSFIMVALILCTVFACKKSEKNLNGAWTPGPIQGFTITPISGGAEITYDIPNDADILYIMAEYERNGKVFTEKSSVHKNKLRIEGFNTTESVPVTLYKVNKKEERSEPLALEFTPLESIVGIAVNTLEMKPGFGGIIATWDNPETTELGVRLMVKEDNELVTKEMYFSTIDKDLRSFRGFESEEITFAISFEDKWGNISDTTEFTTTPFYEVAVPKPYADFRENIPYDNTSNLAAARPFSLLWDNIVNTASHGWLTNPGNSGLSITIDLQQTVKLSRIIIHGYHLNSVYGQANITQFEAWGTNKIELEKLKDRPYWLDETSVRNGAIHGIDITAPFPTRTFKDDWQYLGWHAIPRYDRMVPPDNQAIANLGANGTEYTMPIDAEPVRYVRIFVREITSNMPPPANNYFSMGEITFYGDNTVPQE